jgi:hypothetical protein
VVRRLEQVEPDLVLGEVQDREVALLVEELGAPAVDHDLARKRAAHAAREVLEVNDRPLRGRVEVEHAGG